MKNIALCVYTDDPNYVLDNFDTDYDVFFSYDTNKLYALKKVSILKKLKELERKKEYDVCIAYNPIEANLSDISEDLLKNIEENKIYYSYGYFNTKRFVVGGNPSLFYSKSLEFNRASEFYDNIKNIYWTREERIEEKFLYHIRSLLLKDECVNYENSSLFIRAAEID